MHRQEIVLISVQYEGKGENPSLSVPFRRVLPAVDHSRDTSARRGYHGVFAMADVLGVLTGAPLVPREDSDRQLLRVLAVNTKSQETTWIETNLDLAVSNGSFLPIPS